LAIPLGWQVPNDCFTGAKEHANVMHNADAIAAMRACCVLSSPISALSLSPSFPMRPNAFKDVKNGKT